MLQFFRKYQKFFFIFVTIVIVFSFSFFGTFSTFLNQEEHPDREIGKCLDGSALMQRELDLMTFFLKHAGSDHFFMNEDVIQKDFLATGLGVMLVERYFDSIKPDLESRMRRAKNFTPYEHPQASFLGAMPVWERFLPEMKELFEKLSANHHEEVTIEDFSLLCNFYLAQSKFPPHLLKQFLMYQQNQINWIKPDPYLHRDDLSLFGFQSQEDWFGSRFLQLISQFIINAAKLAQAKGYVVSKDEVRSDLILFVQKAMQKQFSKPDINISEAKGHYFAQLNSMGIEEKQALQIWSKVIYFRKLMNEVGESIFLDPAFLNNFHEYSREVAKGTLYQLSNEFNLKNFSTLLKFEFYLDAIAGKDRKNGLELPEQFLPIESIEKQFPELVQKRFLIEFTQVSKESLSNRVKLKDTWDWQLQEEHFSSLKEQFPILSIETPQSREEMRQALEKLDEDARLKIDQYARLKIVEDHPEWIEEALSTGKMQKETLAIHMKGEVPLFNKVTDPKAFLKLLEAKSDRLLHYSPDGNIFYRIHVLEDSQNKELLTFSEALENHILDDLLDRYFAEMYPLLKKRESKTFLQEDGSELSFENAKEKIGTFLYRNQLKAIEKSCEKEEVNFQDLNQYASHRFCYHMNRIKEKLSLNDDGQKWIRTQDEIGNHAEPHLIQKKPLYEQWYLQKTSKEYLRAEKEKTSEMIFSVPVGQWSNLLREEEGNLGFFHLTEKTKSQSSPKEILEMQKLLDYDAKRCYMNQLLDLFKEKGLLQLIDNP